MLITVKELVKTWSIQPSGVIHVGAHAGEESNDYRAHNWAPVIWVEANPHLIHRLREVVAKEDTVICAALWDENQVPIEFNIATNGESSSLLQPALHLEEYPEIHFGSQITLQTSRLDSLFTEIPNFLNLDVQGAELRVLRGMGKLIDSLDYIYTEVNEAELYVNCAKLVELEKFLEVAGFKRLCLRRHGRSGWGDALFVRKELRIYPSIRILNRTLICYFKIRIYSLLSKKISWLKPKIQKLRNH
jgi:FkbM family methyltransferase